MSDECYNCRCRIGVSGSKGLCYVCLDAANVARIKYLEDQVKHYKQVAWNWENLHKTDTAYLEKQLAESVPRSEIEKRLIDCQRIESFTGACVINVVDVEQVLQGKAKL